MSRLSSNEARAAIDRRAAAMTSLAELLETQGWGLPTGPAEAAEDVASARTMTREEAAKLLAALAGSQKQAAEMREAFERVENLTAEAAEAFVALRKAFHSSDAGRDYVPRIELEALQKRLDAAEECAELLDIYRGMVPERARSALAAWKNTK